MLKPVSVARSGYIASGNVGWPHLASGAARSGHHADASVASGNIASGQIALIHHQSGFTTSGLTLSGAIGSGQVGFPHLANASVQSGTLVSGQIFNFHLASGGLQSGAIGSGTIGGFELASGAIISGRVASGVIGFGHLANASVQSGTIASGQVGKPHIASGAIGSGQLAVGGTPTGTKLLQDDFTWVTPGAATVNSGDISLTKFASGVSTRYEAPYVSGLGLSRPLTEEGISGVRAVQMSPSGGVRVAMASVSGRMPAVGVVWDNVASGIECNIYALGVFRNTSGLTDTSGFGQLVYVGRSGQVCTASGLQNSGGLLSGDVTQPLGILTNSGEVLLSVAAMVPLVAGLVTSGNIASGQVGFGHLANASVRSGTVGSGQLATYHLASGALINHAAEVTPINSGGVYGPALISEEVISGVRAVQITPSGTVRIAMSAVSGRGPAIGVVYDGVLSGIRVNVHAVGFVQYPDAGSGLSCDFSGNIGRRVFVGRSGNLVYFSGSYGSGGFASGGGGGFYSQTMGIIANSGGVLILLGQAMSGGSYSGGENGPNPFFYGG